MAEKMKWVKNGAPCYSDSDASAAFSREDINKVRRFFSRFEAYAPTPLHSLPGLARHLGVAGIYVKDESCRMELNAFKVLGGCYAVARRLAARLGKELEDISFEELKSEEMREKTGEIVFATATDGNHGRGVAWTAKQLGQKAVVYMPKGSALKRVENIEAMGAKVIVTDLNYNETVRMAIEEAARNGWEIIQDTAWEGYDEIPLYIMQGYALMALEAQDQLKVSGIEKPTHVFVQAGVGSMAGAVIAFMAKEHGEQRPVMAVVEPNKADCIYRSMQQGEICLVDGDMDTIMAGLACGEPNPIAWEIIKRYADMAASVPEHFAAQGMRILGNPLKGDPSVVSGESGAVTTGFLSALMREEGFAEARKALGLDASSRILVFSTEGETDPLVYRKVVWDGCYPWKEVTDAG